MNTIENNWHETKKDIYKEHDVKSVAEMYLAFQSVTKITCGLLLLGMFSTKTVLSECL